MKLRSKDGIEMMDVKSIDSQEDLLIIKGKMMGTMNTTIHVSPEELWSAFLLIPTSTIPRIPVLLAKGWWRARKGGRSPLRSVNP